MRERYTFNVSSFISTFSILLLQFKKNVLDRSIGRTGGMGGIREDRPQISLSRREEKRREEEGRREERRRGRSP